MLTDELIKELYGDDNNFELTGPYVISFARAIEAESTAPLLARIAELERALDDLLAIRNDSQGVAGYHLNGDVAGWDEFQEVSAAESALSAAPAAQPATRADGMPASPDERRLRRLLAVRVGMPHTYLDDGEAHGTEHGIVIDFMRDPVPEIDAKLRALNVARSIVVESAEPAAQPDKVLVDLDVLEAAADSLGSFCSDHGWSDADMQNLDNLLAFIAQHKAKHGIKEQP